jgi:hypothetical protein
VYTDEGSNSYTISSNVLLSNGIFYARNGVNTANNAFTGNYGKNGGGESGNTIVKDLASAPQAAKDIANRAGVEIGKRGGRPVSNPN